jgi:cell wall-associated NlpC family hydrolase
VQHLIHRALAFALCLAATTRAAHADTTTTTASGVQMIVTTPDVPQAKKPKPKNKPAARTDAVAVAPASDGPSDTNKRYTNALVENAEALVGRPYRFGGASPAGFDCSGFTQYAFATVGIRIPRTADAQFAQGRPVAGNPQPGDLVFFQTYDYGASHVALYLGGGRFINAIGKDVHLADFGTPYFRGRYIGARRFLPD